MVADSVTVHHKEIGGLGYRVENLEHAHGTLVRKKREVSDAQVDDIITIREIQPKVLGSQHDLIVNKIVEVEDQVLKIQDREDNHPCKQVFTMYLLRLGYQELGYANNTNEVRKLLGLTSTKGGHGLPVPRLKVGMDKTSSPKTKGGNGRL
ncbi:hypothetical protein Tco_1062725, partial [Tanacetum coccineum]